MRELPSHEVTLADDQLNAARLLRKPEAAAESLPREARAVVLAGPGPDDWGARVAEALAGHSEGSLGTRWIVETARPGDVGELDPAPDLLVVAPGSLRAAGVLVSSSAHEPRIVAICETGEPAEAEGSGVAPHAWVSSADATRLRLRAVCDRELEVLDLRREVEHWRVRFRDLYDRSLAGLYRIDGNGVVVEANETFARLLGYDSRGSLLGVRLEEFVDGEEESAPLQRPGQGRRPFWSRRVCLRRRDGSRLWGLMNDQRLPSGDAGLFEGSLIEATREHELASDLLQQEALYVEIFGAMTEPTLLLDEEGVVLACNHRAERLLDRRALELVGRPVDQGVRELLALDGERLELGATPLLSGELRDGSEEAALGIRRHDGKVLWLMVRSRRIPAPRGSRRGQYLVSMVDRTDLRELSQRAQRAEVESLLTQGLVHDVRNLLTAVRAAANFLEVESEDAAGVRGYAEQIDRVTSSANVLLTRALETSKERESTAIELDRLVNEMSPMLRRVTRDRRLTVRTGAPRSFLWGDRIELEQVLFNLLSNAREATSEDGRVELRTSLVDEETSPRIRLEIEDDGCGMTEEVRSRAFEPLFTRRRGGGGGGLGLFNVAHIVRDMGGRIELASAPGEGTTVRVDFPLV